MLTSIRCTIFFSNYYYCSPFIVLYVRCRTFVIKTCNKRSGEKNKFVRRRWLLISSIHRLRHTIAIHSIIHIPPHTYKVAYRLYDRREWTWTVRHLLVEVGRVGSLFNYTPEFYPSNLWKSSSISAHYGIVCTPIWYF